MPEHDAIADPPQTAGSVGPNRAEDADWFRRVLGQYPTGVSVVTGIAADGSAVGLAVGSFTSVSLDPPLVAFLPAATSSTWPKIRQAGRFCVNVLAADQEPVCRTFASRASDKFAGLSWRPASSGAPILDGAVAWVDCDLDTVHEAGDHLIVIGRVRDLHIERPTLPLLFFQGGYGRFSPHSLAIRDTRFAAQPQLVDQARPLMETLAQRIGAQVAAAHCDGNELTMLASAGAPDDARVLATVIGQRLPVTAPVGIWWMAFAAPALVDRWLAGIQTPILRARYQLALELIRMGRNCLGLASVQTEIETLINSRSRPGVEPTDQERTAIGGLDLDPMDFVAPTDRPDSIGGPHRDAVSLWAPVFDTEGTVSLGLMLSGVPAGGPALPDYAEDLRQLADAVSALSTT
ncbi:MAG: flavin reductase family protein [Jatrophihabitans sp.]